MLSLNLLISPHAWVKEGMRVYYWMYYDLLPVKYVTVYPFFWLGPLLIFVIMAEKCLYRRVTDKFVDFLGPTFASHLIRFC